MNIKVSFKTSSICVMTIAMIIAACGGGSSDSTLAKTQSTINLSGTAATGVAISGGWQMRVMARPNDVSFDDFTGVQFYISKPKLQ